VASRVVIAGLCTGGTVGDASDAQAASVANPRANAPARTIARISCVRIRRSTLDVMNNRHAFHAGNFADVLMMLVEHLKK
jgi:hypothetical protein